MRETKPLPGLETTSCYPLEVLIRCTAMVARHIKNLFLDKLKETGDDPGKVECIYYIRPPYFPGAPVQLMNKCLAAGLPECDFSALSGGSEKYIYRLVKTTKEMKIETYARQG